MRKRRGLSIAIVLFGCLLAMLLKGCFWLDAPPKVDSVQKQFMDYRKDIHTVVEFMVHSGYESISIDNSNGTIWADFQTIQVDDEAAKDAIARLLSIGAYYDIYKNGNTISFLQWKGARDIGCGIAYTINRCDLPEVQYTTELVSINEEGWFYYVADYNKWRINEPKPSDVLAR